MPLNPWVIVGALAGAIAFAGAGYWKGRTDGAAACETRISAMQSASQEKKDVDQHQADEAGDKLEQKNADAKIVYRTITKTVDRVVERPVYRNACFDDDGLHLANAALSGKAPPTGERDGPLPGPDAAR